MSTTTVERQTTGWIPDASTFGARLALIRQHKGWSNIAMAARACGVPVDSWRNWEVDGREPHRLTTVGKQIAGASGVDYLWLVHGPDLGEGGGGGPSDVTLVKDPLAERLIKPRTRARTQPNGRPAGHRHTSASSDHPTQRRPQRVGSPNRTELTAA